MSSQGMTHANALHSARHGRRQAGASLIESLIAIVVMALGLLAVLGTQLHTLGNTQNSVRRTQAIRLIDDLSERMKSMPDAISLASAFTMGWSRAVATTGVPDCSTTACIPSQLAQFEMNRWLASVKDSLPLGQANVFAVEGEPRQLGVMLAWRANDKDTPEAAALLAPLSTGAAQVSCPEQRICHLQYISLNQRCLSVDADRAYCSGP